MIDPLTALGAVSLFLFGVFCGEEWAASKARRHHHCPTCLARTDDEGIGGVFSEE